MEKKMTEQLNTLGAAIAGAMAAMGRGLQFAGRRAYAARRVIAGAAIVGAAGYALYKHPPVRSVPRGNVGVRTNALTGGVAQFGEGSVLVLPGIEQMRLYPLHDMVYHPTEMASASGLAPLQSSEGLSIGVDLSVRYALDPARIASISKSLPDDINGQIVEPAVQGVVYKVFTRYTVREIFATRRAEIQQTIESELRGKLARDGIVLRSVQMGKVDLPADYRAGMERLLAEELATEKMRYTLELKDKQVQESALEAEAEKVRREKAAEAAAQEQIIAAKAQEEAMKHVLPFKQKQIEQRSLEAEAEKQARIKNAEANAQARRIEAAGEADSRRKLADAETYRMEEIGKAQSEQMARDGALISKHPLLIQKTLADKLSDKVQVIIAPPGSGGFIGSALLNGVSAQGTAAAANASADNGESQQ
jgi:regulator of protease activity HflC (stomatin/prohibitin superfamily)